MRITKQRVIAGAALLGVVAVLFAAWPHVRAYIEESRLIGRLESKDRGEQEAAAAELAKRGSVRAIPALLRVASPEWLGGLHDAYDASKYARDALEQILALEPVAAFRVLARCLKDEEVVIRREAAKQFYGGGPWMVEALPSLLDALHDPDPIVRVGVAYPLWFLCVDSDVLVPALLDALEDGESDPLSPVNLLGLIGEGAAGSAAPDLAKRAKKAMMNGRSDRAWGALSTLGTAGTQVIAGLLADSDPRVREEAAYQLERMGPAASPAVGALTRALKDVNEEVRQRAIQALGAIGPTAHDAVPDLVAALQRSEGAKDAMAAVEALGEIGAEAGEALPALLGVVATEGSELAAAAVRAIGSMCPEPAQVLPVLVGALDDRRDDVRTSAMEALARLGPDARPVVDYIADHFHDESYRVRAWAAAAVIAMGEDTEGKFLPQVIRTVGVYEEDLSNTSLRILELLGPLAKGAAPKLVEFVLREREKREGLLVSFQERHRSMTELDLATLALAQVGVTAEYLRPAVVALKEEKKRGRAFGLLTDLGPAAAVVLPELIEALDDSDVQVREDVVRVLNGIGPGAEPAVPKLARLLSAKERLLRLQAWDALHHILQTRDVFRAVGLVAPR